MSSNNKKLCPLLDKTCVEDECNLWGESIITQPTMLVGQTKVQSVRGCDFGVTPYIQSLILKGK